MDSIIINNELINKNQIARIYYEVAYHKKTAKLHEITKFLWYAVLENGDILKYSRDAGLLEEKEINPIEADTAYTKIIKSSVVSDIYDIQGKLTARIELSSGTTLNVVLFEFTKVRWYDWFKREEPGFGFREINEGIMFKKEDINIEIVCDVLFKNKKYTATKKEI